jgi:type I restriction enzyme S subunit
MSNGGEHNRLPNGWTVARLGDICHVNMGQSPPSSTYNTDAQGLPFFQGKAEFGDLFPDPRVWCTAPSKVAQVNDVLVSIRAPVGPTNLAPKQCCIGRGLAALHTLGDVHPRYVLYAMRFRATELDSLGTGTTFKAVSGGVLRGFQIAVAPLPEQRRIVAKIEELFSDLDAGVAALQRVKANLKRYRASVLKAAVEGRLTAKWREEHPNVEPARKLLERILAERRKKWEADQLAKFKAAGKTPPKDWQAKYVEPTAPDTSNLSELPKGWCWARLEAIGDVVGGLTKDQKRANRPGMREVPYLRVANVQQGFLDLREMKNIIATEQDVVDLRLQPGDVLFTEGGDRDKLGRGWVWNGELPECVHQNHIFRARLFVAAMQPQFVSHHGNTFGREWFTKAGKQTTNLASINLAILRQFPVPIAPAEEQRQVVGQLDERLSQISEAEMLADHGLKRAARLRQSILKRAFEGKLVPQEPTDEPASVLLEHIRTQAPILDGNGGRRRQTTAGAIPTAPRKRGRP